ncbi:hypothetical protein N7495_000277 [Penicillium taxi]|uniref:uncharacterized protein n=1 Tax=Penicillium taxi TaxID=168475 RepID=UPI002545ABC5|nr:uncharacterized protein N7495_000277 [Penicillium taxi]KAJ5907595.1 hypothetical protein N7495_000277 [Penicillium taxi]
MGVGDYVHSKEAGQPRAHTDMGPSQRQLRAAQSKVEVPVTRLGDLQSSGRVVSLAFQEQRNIPDQQARPPTESGGQRDMFDTDVEGVDDSTIAATSVHAFDDGRSQEPSAIKHYVDFVPPPSYLPRPSNRGRSTWFEGYSDNAMKKAGFDTDLEDSSSQATSSVGAADDEKIEDQAVEQGSWFMAHRNRSAEEPLSKRLENFWSARKRQSKPVDQLQTMSQPQSPVEIVVPELQSQPRKLGHMLPPTAARKITLPPSMTSTPRTRFSPPKPSLLDQLDLSPPRYGSAPPSQTGRTISITAFHDHSDDEDDTGNDETIRLSSRRASGKSFNTYDITNVTDNHGEVETQGPFLSHSISTSTSNKHYRRNTVINTKKRNFEADYPPNQLYQKSFAELQAEPFEKIPTRAPTPVKSPSLSPQPSLNIAALSPNDAASHIMSIGEKDRQAYLSRISVDEWEDCGDQLIDQFSKLLTEMKKLRRARRQTAAVFESEIRRRHELVEAQNSDLSQKLDEMRTGGAEVLRGRKT